MFSSFVIELIVDIIILKKLTIQYFFAFVLKEICFSDIICLFDKPLIFKIVITILSGLTFYVVFLAAIIFSLLSLKTSKYAFYDVDLRKGSYTEPKTDVRPTLNLVFVGDSALDSNLTYLTESKKKEILNINSLAIRMVISY